VPIRASRGLIALPVPQALFLTLAPLGIYVAGIGTAGLESGSGGARALLGQVLRWRVHLAWYVAAVVGPALIPAGAALLGGAIRPSVETWFVLALLILGLVVPAIPRGGWDGVSDGD
jgi:hypothetical protein